MLKVAQSKHESGDMNCLMELELLVERITKESDQAKERLLIEAEVSLNLSKEVTNLKQ